MLNLSWQEKASCFGQGTTLFFPEEEDVYESIDLLRLLCRRCPMLEQCKDHSLRYEEFGFWAGMTKAERDSERRKRGIIRRSIKTSHLYAKGEYESETKNTERDT